MQLKSLSEFNGDQVRGVETLGYILEASPVLRALDTLSAWEESALTGLWTPTNDSSTVTYRALDSSDAPSYTDESLDAQISYTLKVMTATSQRDMLRMVDEQRGHGTAERDWNNKLKARARNWGKSIDSELFVGTGQTTHLKGLSTILDGTNNIPGFSETRVVNAADKSVTSGAKIFDWTLGGTSFERQCDAFIEGFDYWKSLVDNPNVIFCNSKLKSRITTAARMKSMYSQITDIYGYTLDTIAGIPIVQVLDTTILNTEPDSQDTPANDSTSLYIGSLGELKTSLVTNSGFYYMSWNNPNNSYKGQERWEMSVGWKIEEPKSILRVRNIVL